MTTSCAPRTGQVWCADLITIQVGSFSFLCFGPSWPRPIVSPFEVWLFVSPNSLSAPLKFGSLSALSHRWPILKFGSLLALARRQPFLKFGSLSVLTHCRSILEFGSLLALFESAFTSHLPLSLVAPAASTIYGMFPASATTVIIVSYFKFKVVEYSTLSLRVDVRIFYIILVYYVAFYVLGFSIGFLAYHS